METEAIIIKFRAQNLPEKINIYNTERKIKIQFVGNRLFGQLKCYQQKTVL